MNSILKQIVEKKRADLILMKQNSFLNLVKNKMGIIAEIKLSSPTVPFFGSTHDIIQKVIDYEQAAADAISVITEKHFFKGRPEFISRIKKKVSLPILQKDFIIDPFQIYEAKMIGANALLLIAKIVNEQTLIKFVSLCQEIGLEPIVEINDEDDFKKALATSTKIIAVNARNLETFIVDIDIACKLIKKIPNQFIKLGFSGIMSSVEVKKYQQAGAKGVLIGTALMKARNVKNYMNSLRVS